MIYPVVLFIFVTLLYFYSKSSHKISLFNRIWKTGLKTIISSGLVLSIALLLSNFWGYYLSKELLFQFKWFYPFKENFILTCLVCLLIFQFIVIFQYWLKNSLIKKQSKRPSWISLISQTTGIVLFLLGITVAYAGRWLVLNFGGVSIDQVVYAISQPIAGTDMSQIKSFIRLALVPVLAITYITTVFTVLINCYTIPKLSDIKWPKISHKIFLYTSRILFGLSVLGAGIYYSVSKLGYEEVKAYFFEKSSIFEDYYVDPKVTEMTFPAQKKNLIYIFLESVETTYLSREVGGQQEHNLMPHLTELAMSSGINFSNSETLGGALQVPGTGYTVGAMVAQSSGIPIIGDGNAYGETDDYIPGAYSIGEVLKQEGYSNTLMIGSEASFAGRDKYYEQHGNYDILDYEHAIDTNWIPTDYREWWGYEDEKLFEFSKEVLSDLANKEQPFNFTMLTADTHFEDGYLSSNTPLKFEDQYSNVISFSDELLAAFLTWIKEQPFYDNTVVVISGDHLSMDQDFFNHLDHGYQRTVFNVILNSTASPLQIHNRQYSTMDLYPTTLAAMGVKIEVERLGLGTNLFSNEPTLIELLGYDDVTAELGKRSDFYNQSLMQNTNYKLSEDIRKRTYD